LPTDIRPMSRKKKKNRAPLPDLPAGCYLVDSHCHLDMSAYADDCAEVIARAKQAGVAKVMTIGIDLPSSQAAVALAESYPNIFAGVGVHPHHAAETTDADYDRIYALAAHPKVKAYGEIGLDYVKNYAPEAVQKEHFIRQVELAKELSLPLIIHDREAHDDTMAILRAHAPFAAGGVMHCFSGDISLAKAVIDLGFFLSIPGVVTFNKADTMQQVAREIPLKHLLVETDGPFLSPDPWRGKRNEPAYTLYTAARIAALKGVELAEVAAATTANAETLFGIGG